MNSSRSVMLLWISFLLPLFSISEKTKIDWETEVMLAYERCELDYGAHDMNQLVRDSYADGFVYITQNSILQGSTRDLADLYTARSKIGHWEPGRPNIIFTCDNSVLMWTKLFFTNDRNFTQEGKAVILNEYISDMAKIKLIQKSP